MRGDMHGHSAYGELVDTRISAIDWEAKTLEVTYTARADFLNRIGTVAGGMLAAMLDSATGLVAIVGLPEERVAVHTHLEVRYRRPAQPGRLAARARVVEQTEREVHSQAELLDAEGQTVATAEARLRIVPKQRRLGPGSP